MQSPQLPTVHEYGIGGPAARPASRSVWPGSTTTELSSTRISCGAVVVAVGSAPLV
jgi:hypothetical protein